MSHPVVFKKITKYYYYVNFKDNLLFIAEEDFALRSILTKSATRENNRKFIFSTLETLMTGLKGFKNIVLYLDLNFENQSELKKVLDYVVKREDILLILAKSEETKTVFDPQDYNPFFYLTKPFNEDTFLTSIRSALRKMEFRRTCFSFLVEKISKHNYSSNDMAQELASLIKNYRKENNLTQNDCANNLGISSRQLQRIESGVSNITLDNLFIILKYIGSPGIN